jgi:phenylalanyl-tRNA synthetase beta chain
VAAGALGETAADAAGRLLEASEIFDLYQGEGVPEGHRSLAMRFRFRAPDRTLTDEEVEKAMQRITHRFAEEWGVHVRGGK